MKKARRSSAPASIRVNVQDLLRDMNAERREDHQTVIEKMESGFTTVTQLVTKVATDLEAHEKADVDTANALDGRLKPLESLNRGLKWLAGAVAVAIIGGIADLMFNHLPRLLASAGAIK